MRIIIDGKIRENEDLFKTVEKEYIDKYGYHPYKEYYMGYIKISDDRSGNFYIDIDDLEDDVPAQIPQEMVIGFSILTGLHGGIRFRGVYELGGAKAVIEGTKMPTVTVTGTSIKDVRELYLKIRAGTILPTENWEVEQIKPSFRQRLSFALHQVFTR